MAIPRHHEEFVASFPARLGELRRLLPPGFEPARLAPGAGLVEVGSDHPVALELDRLLLSRRALGYTTTPQFEAIPFGPERLTLPLVHRGLAAVRAAEREEVGV